MKLLQALGARSMRHWLGASALCLCAPSWAGLGTSVTLAPAALTDIYPGQSTTLRITLSNSNTTSAVNAVAFSNLLPGSLPNGLKVAGAASYSCADANGAVASTGTLSTSIGGQAISLAGATVPPKLSTTDGSCTIDIPVTAGTNSGSATTYTYTIAGGAVSGNDGGSVSNVGAVSQSINVRSLRAPTISKQFVSSTLVLGGAVTRMTLTISNPNAVAMTGIGLTDLFPALANPAAGGSSQALIQVAATPNASASCPSGVAPTFAPAVAAGDSSISVSGGTLAANGSCTVVVDVEASHTAGVYSQNASNRINRTTQFQNDVGLPAAADAVAGFTVRSPLDVSKTGTATLAAGQVGSFVITLRNNGSSPLTASFSDAQIDGNTNAGYGLTVSGVSATDSAGNASCAGSLAITGANEGVSLTGGVLPAGGSCTVTINYTGALATANTPQAFTNTLVGGAVDVGNPAIVSQPASASVTIYDTFNITKSGPNPGNAAPGSPARYQVTVQNWSTSPMLNVAIADALANGQTFLTGVIGGVDYTPTVSGTGGSCGVVSSSSATGAGTANLSVASVPARTSSTTAGSCTVSFWAMTATGASVASSYTNQLAAGSVCYNPSGTTECNGVASNTVTGSVAAVMSVAKSFSPAGPLNEGVITRMTIAISNLSVNPLSSVAISDNLPRALAGSGQMRVATPANAATTCGGAAVITALANSTSVQMTGASVPARANGGTGAAGSCNLQVDVVAAAGSYSNTAAVTGSQTYANGSTASNVGPVSANASITFNSALCSSSAPCSKSFNPASVSSGARSTVTIHLVNSGALALSGVALTDPLPSGMRLATPPNAYTSCAGGTSVTAVAGSTSVALTGATVAGNASCDLVFDVTATGSASWTNTLAPGVITANGGVSNQSAVTGVLNYSAPTNLTVAKATSPSTLTFPGQVSQLTITITNGSSAVSNLGLTDYFTLNGLSGSGANGMAIASTPAAATTCPGGLVTAQPGAALVALSGASMAANATCNITVNITSAAVGGITNFIPASAIQSDQGLTNSSQVSTSLTTQSNVGIAKQFTPNVVKPGERSRLRITLYNPTAQPVTTLSVVDNLPANMLVPAGANPQSNCTGASVFAPSASSVQVSGANIVAASGGMAASCWAEIDVQVALPGDYVNSIPVGAISAVVGGTPVTNTQPASDTLRAKLPVVIHTAFSSLTQDSGNPTPFTTGVDTKAPGQLTTLTIQLNNPNAVALTQANLTDLLPVNVVVAATPNASTTCANGLVLATAAGTSVRLAGATLAANQSCTVTLTVLSNISGSYSNSIPTGSVSTFEGVSNESATSAQLVISTPPTVAKQFVPSVMAPGGISTLTIILGNANATAATLSAAFTDTLPTAPGALLVAATPNLQTSCPGSVTATALSGRVVYASGALVPPGGCSISVDVTGSTVGNYNNNIAAGSLVSNFGSNQQAANAPLVISTLGYVSGRVFQDNNVTPNGSYEPAVDAPMAGVSIELRSSNTGNSDCASPLLVLAGLTNPAVTDALGNYLFSGLAAGSYAVCQQNQPGGTTNGITTAGSITAIAGSTGTPGVASNPTATSSQVVNVVLGSGGAGSVSGSANNNFAEVVPSSIAGTVYLDTNNNGLQDGAEAGIAQVGIELLNSGGVVIASTTTDAGGHYNFGSLQPGSYSVREPLQPAGTSSGLTTPGALANGGSAGTATPPNTRPSLISAIVLPPNTNATGNNFGEIPNGRSVSGMAFLDFNNNGLPDGADYGLAALSVTLSGLDINGGAVSLTTTTGADGRYSFGAVPESNASGYTLTQSAQPTGTTNGITRAGSTGGTPSGAAAVPATIAGVGLAGADTVSANNNFAKVPSPAPDLSLAKSHSPSSFAAGSATGYYTLTPSNVGALPTLGSVTVVDTLPAGITLAQLPSGSGWSCSGAVGASSFSCSSSDVIAAGGTGPVIQARVAVASGLDGQILINTATISGGGEPAILSGNNTASDAVAVATSAAVSGHVWLDATHDRIYNPASGAGQGGWKVELLLNGVLVASTTTASDGAYAFANLAPGSGYQIRFRHPVTNLVWGRATPNELGSSYSSGVAAGSTNQSSGVRSGANPAGAVVGDGTLSNLTFVSGTTTVQQSLPIDPAGVVYDSVTRQPVAGAVVSISGPSGFNPALDLVGGQSSFTTGNDGQYQFLLNASAPAGNYRLSVTTYPGGYSTQPSSIIPVCSATLAVGATPAPAMVQAGNSAPAPAATLHAAASCPASTGALNAGNQASTQYYSTFQLSSTSANVVNNHIPIDPMSGSGFAISKSADKQQAEVGDTVRYTLEVRLNSNGLLPQVTVRDVLPAGFTLVLGTVQINGVRAANPSGGIGPVLGFNLGSLRGSSNTFGTAPQSIRLQYRVRVGVGAQQGTGINVARAIGCSLSTGCLSAGALQPVTNSVQSNQAQYQVTVGGGVFSDLACVAGKIFVDCNHNHVQDPEELGIPGVRLYFEDGAYVVSDSEGKYSRCGMPPRSHVLAADASTLPRGAHLTTSSNRNLGDANSLFLDLKNGELHRADFIEGSCSNRVLEQVKARRSQGEIRSVETEREPGPALRFYSKPPGAPQQGTDSAKQPLVQPRLGASDAK
jgi:large repetitive protein